jgi:hypothetical protein
MPATSAGAQWQGMADVTTTTTEETGRANMSELAKTIDRLEQWVEYWEPHQVPELIADLRTLIRTAKAVSRAVEMLQDAEDVTVTFGEEGGEALMVCAHVVDHAVAILRGECTE